MMEKLLKQKFGPFIIDPRQIFFESEYSFASVNLKPVSLGHILVVTKREVSNTDDLSS